MLKKLQMLPWLILSMGCVYVDQCSKLWVVRNISFAGTKKIWPWLNFSLVYNNGAAFGLLADSSGWQRWFLIVITLVVSSYIIYWGVKSIYRVEKYGLALIFGGAIGNLLDRLQLGVVVDFIDVHWQNWHWYTFNVADSCICIGAAMLLLAGIITR